MDGFMDLTDLLALALWLNKERHERAQDSSAWVLFFHRGCSCRRGPGLVL